MVNDEGMAEAVVIPQPGRVELCEVGLPDLEPAQIRLRTRVSLISTGTESIVYKGRFAPGTHWDQWFSYPHRPGYSLVGEVSDVGHEVAGDFSAGDRVVALLGHASQHVVDASLCTRVPDDVSDEDAAWFALAKVGFVGVEASHARVGSSALVVGAGPVGQMAVRWLAASGAAEVVVVHRSGGLRLDLARAGGATAVLQRDLADGLPGMAPPDTILDCTGNPDVLTHALAAVADHGRVVMVGDVGDPSQQRLSSDLIVRGLTVVGAHGRHLLGGREHDVRRLFFRLVASGRFAGMNGLVTHKFTPHECTEAYALLDADRTGTMGVIFDWQ
ncbi:zinc-dependent alcohol dehydrogenase [Actinopolymorpha alba]|uniref:zinc-dependent alcohol dehydrogenase n=1 Tax=Actinopolymorpha alba TaxID=533267 RepID=UPI00037B8997|nr:zinc-binding alcohol dehydrogenase [Actinopolymorpha alba]